MRQGQIRMSPCFITNALQFPGDWEIESMSFKSGDKFISAVISGKDFPEMTDIEGANIKDCRIIIHKEYLRFEVREL